MKITNEMIEQVYTCGKRMHNGISTLPDSKAKLIHMGMNENSAHKYLIAISAMFNGSHYGSTISAPATDYFLKNIFAEYGSQVLKLALDSLKSHLDYQADKNNLPGHWRLYDIYYSKMS